MWLRETQAWFCGFNMKNTSKTAFRGGGESREGEMVEEEKRIRGKERVGGLEGEIERERERVLSKEVSVRL